MSLIGPRRSPSRASSRSPGYLKWFAAGLTGLALLTFSYQSAIADAVASGPFYPPIGGGNRGDNGGLSTGEKVGIAIGSAIVVGGVLYLTHVIGPKPNKTEGGTTTSSLGELPAGQTVSEARLTPGKAELVTGAAGAFDLQVRSEDGKWYSVTTSPETTLSVAEGEKTLVQLDGSKNGFCVPVTASVAPEGKTVLVTGTYAPKGQAPLSATARVTVRPGE